MRRSSSSFRLRPEFVGKREILLTISTACLFAGVVLSRETATIRDGWMDECAIWANKCCFRLKRNTLSRLWLVEHKPRQAPWRWQQQWWFKKNQHLALVGWVRMDIQKEYNVYRYQHQTSIVNGIFIINFTNKPRSIDVCNFSVGKYLNVRISPLSGFKAVCYSYRQVNINTYRRRRRNSFPALTRLPYNECAGRQRCGPHLTD